MKLWRRRKQPPPDEIAAAFADVDVYGDNPEKDVRKSERKLIELQIAGSIVVIVTSTFYVLVPAAALWNRALNAFTMIAVAWAVGYNGGTLFIGRRWRKTREAHRHATATRSLSTGEINHVNAHHTCPDCAIGQLLHGPHGGLSINVKCDNPECRHEFSIAFFHGRAVGGERLERDEPSLYHGPLWK